MSEHSLAAEYQLTAMEQHIETLQAENARLREELEQARAETAVLTSTPTGRDVLAELAAAMGREERTDAYNYQLSGLLREIKWDISEEKEFKGTEHGRIRRDQIEMVLEESTGREYAERVKSMDEMVKAMDELAKLEVLDDGS